MTPFLTERPAQAWKGIDSQPFSSTCRRTVPEEVQISLAFLRRRTTDGANLSIVMSLTKRELPSGPFRAMPFIGRTYDQVIGLLIRICYILAFL